MLSCHIGAVTDGRCETGQITTSITHSLHASTTVQRSSDAAPICYDIFNNKLLRIFDDSFTRNMCFAGSCVDSGNHAPTSLFLEASTDHLPLDNKQYCCANNITF
jgi:hypothetical protein